MENNKNKTERKTVNTRPAYVMINDEIVEIVTGEDTIRDAKRVAYDCILKNNEKYIDKNINIKILSLYIDEYKEIVTETKLKTK